MQVIEIKPSNIINFKLPYQLTSKFTIGNLTLRTVCIYIVTLHPHVISVNNKCFFIDAFQEMQVNVMLHWGQEINNFFKSKVRVYIWELYDEESIEIVISKMFNKETDGNCLLFQQLTINVDIDSNYLQTTCSTLPHIYQISRINLPNVNLTNITQQMLNRVLNHCQKLGKIKAIYNYNQHQYIVEFGQLQDIVGSFCQVRDVGDNLVIFGIGCTTSLGNVLCSPDLLYLQSSNKSVNKTGDNGKNASKKEVTKMSFILRENQSKKTEQIINKYEHNIQNNISTLQQQQIKIQNNKFQLPSQKQKLYIPNTENKSIHKETLLFENNQKNKSLVKQSFFMAQQKSRNPLRKRTKSQEHMSMNIDEQQQFSSSNIDIQALNQWRNAQKFQIKPIKQFQQKCLDLNKKILNYTLSSDEKYIYLLLRDCIIICDVDDFKNKRIIKFDPIDVENVHLTTPMILFNKQTMMIFANQSYLFWVSLIGEEEPDWKYVQRKQIYTIQVIQELNLLMVGGKNFSKLSYLGKSTSRSNIKIYSCGKTGKRDHLFTYDIPNCNGQNVMEMKYITTKPNGTKLLLALTSQQKLFFFRVRAFNHIQIYACFQTYQIGIQQIVSMNYYIDSSILICLQKLSQDFLCFKYLKTNCSYEKVQISTESVKLPVTKYTSTFRIGGNSGHQWITAVDNNNCIYTYYLDWKQHQKNQYKSSLKDCLLLKKGAIFRQNTQIRCKLLK